ncbi:MAG: ABC transporter ATP-binding protein [Saprospiraceae bacterium]|nr:ABC transporter ATP-binding protein [Saprospiraceae bacterium]
MNSHSSRYKPGDFDKLARLILQLLKPYYLWMLVIVAAMLTETVMGLAAPWPRVAQNIASDLRRKIYHHLHRLSLAFYDTHQIGKLVSTIMEDVNTFQVFISSTLVTILIDALSIVGMFSLMFYLKWDFALIAMSVAPFLLIFVIRFKSVVKTVTHEVRADQAEMLTIIQEGLESMKAVNAFGREELEENKLQQISLDTLQAALKARKLKSVISPVFTLAVSVCTAFVLWRGATLVISDVMSIGALTVFLAYLNKFFNPVKDLAKMTVNIAQAIVALERIQQILDADMIIPEKPNAINPATLTGDIEFHHVYFSYNQDKPVLKDINLHIHPGQKIGICGPTGSGKSTLIHLIPRLYEATSGRINIDDRDITDYTLHGLRSHISLVLQETLIFYGTIRDNIAYGKPDATEYEIVEASKIAQLHEFISSLPRGYQTFVGERGITLSGGERRRIGIARAILRNTPILLLDEPTASLDIESEMKVCKALDKLKMDRTVITISHKLYTIVNSDHIFVLKDGRVVEEGTHETLQTQGGVYADLIRLNEVEYGENQP